MPGLQVVPQPNNVPSLAPQVVNQPQQPILAPQIQSAPAAPQPAAIPVQSAPSAPQPENLQVDNQPQGQQQSVAVQIPSIITGIQTALNRGADPATILQAIGQQHPDMQAAIQEAQTRGAQPQQILQQIVQQYSGLPANPQEATPQHVGLIQSLVQFVGRPIVEPLVHAGTRIGEAIAAPFNPAAGEQDINVHLPVLGDFNVPAQNKTSFRQEVGNAIKLVSTGIESPTVAGGVYGFGDAQENKRGLLGTAVETGLGSLGGRLGDAAVGKISSVLSHLDEGPAAIFINSLIKPLEKDFRFGKNPGLGVAQEKLVANSLPDLEKQVAQRLHDIGTEIGEKVTQVDPSNTADYSSVLKPFDDAINKAAEGGPNNQALITRLQNAKDALQYEMEVRQGNIVPKLDAETNAPISQNLTDFNAAQGNSLKQKIGGLRKWNGTPSEDTIYNRAVTKAYQTANNIVEQQAPGIKQLNSRYANLLSAQSAIERRTSVEARQSMLNTFDKLGLGAAGLSLIYGDIHGAAIELGLALANHTLGSTAVKTRAAAALSLVPDLSSQLIEENPALKDILQNAGTAATKGGKYVVSRLGMKAASALSNLGH